MKKSRKQLLKDLILNTVYAHALHPRFLALVTIIMWTIIFSIIASACSGPVDPEAQMDPELKPYLERYFTEADRLGIDPNPYGLPMPNLNLTDLWGFDYGWHDGTTIHIDSLFFTLATDTARFQMVAHECGHRFMNYGHTENRLMRGIGHDEFQKNYNEILIEFYQL